jgi:hypothetical protein
VIQLFRLAQFQLVCYVGFSGTSTAFGNYYIRSYDRQSSHERPRDFIGQMKITAKR